MNTPRGVRPLPVLAPTSFVRAHSGRKMCTPARSGKRRSCARSHRVSRI